MKIITVLIFFICLGCSHFGTYRSFEKEMDADDPVFFVPERDFHVVSGDKNRRRYGTKEIMGRIPLNKRMRQELQRPDRLQIELEGLIRSLTDREYSHYEKYVYLLSSVSEKIYFLKLSGIDARNNYLQGRGIEVGIDSNLKIVKDNGLNNSLYLGMSKANVIDYWGRPSRVDIAGKPRYENERWIFYEQGRVKYVFFEKGLVKGWILE